jgi:hypothetical protein
MLWCVERCQTQRPAPDANPQSREIWRHSDAMFKLAHEPMCPFRHQPRFTLNARESHHVSARVCKYMRVLQDAVANAHTDIRRPGTLITPHSRRTLLLIYSARQKCRSQIVSVLDITEHALVQAKSSMDRAEERLTRRLM